MIKYLPALMIALFITSPAFTMEPEVEDKRALKKIQIPFSHNSYESGLWDYAIRYIQERTLVYEDEKETESIARFVNSQKDTGIKIVLELCDATLEQLEDMLSLCTNVVGLKLTNTPYWQSDIYPDDRYIKAIIKSKNLKTLEYVYIQEWEKILDYTYLDFMGAERNLPALKYFYCLSMRDSSAAAFYKAPKLIHIGPYVEWKTVKECEKTVRTRWGLELETKSVTYTQKMLDIQLIESKEENKIIEQYYNCEGYYY